MGTLKKFAAKVGDGNNIDWRLKGGSIGRIFNAVEEGLTRQEKWKEANPNSKQQGPGPRDCS